MVFGRQCGGTLTVGELTFQFPVGIRWCSDVRVVRGGVYATQPFNSPWELDGVRTRLDMGENLHRSNFQFPLGIRWCSDTTEKTGDSRKSGFLSIPPGN